MAIDRSEDRSRSIYIAGGFDGTADFDLVDGAFSLSSDSLSTFVSKIDEAGNIKWTKAMLGTGGQSYAGAIAVDPADGAIYVRGRFKGTVDFDPGDGVHNITGTTTCADITFCGDNFILKLDSGGNFLWARVIGASENVFVSSIAIDPGGYGDVYLTGNFYGTIDFDPGTITSRLEAMGDYDIFISKLNSSGEFQWAKRIGGQGNDFSYSIAIDPNGSGEIFTTGYFDKIVDFDPGPGTSSLTSAVSPSIFICKLDGDGNFKWAKGMGRASFLNISHVGSVALEPGGMGDVYTTGSFKKTGDFNPSNDDTCKLESAGNSDIFISKLDSAGNFKWAKAAGGLKEDYGTALAIQPGGSGNVYIIGRFQESVIFGGGSSHLTSSGDYDIFISKFDSAGNFQWVKAIHGEADDFIAAITLDEESLYLAGFYSSPSISFDTLTIPNENEWADLFIAKLNIADPTSVAEIEKQPFNVYPNPATNELTIEVEGDEVRNLGITIFNVVGEVVFLSTEQYAFKKETIDISPLATGIYFLETNIDGERSIIKIVKE